MANRDRLNINCIFDMLNFSFHCKPSSHAKLLWTIAIIQLPLSSQQLKKPDKTKIPCPICGDLAKPGSGLKSHQRLNKRCIEKAASYISQEIVNNTNITTRKLNSKTKTQNSATNNKQN